MIVGLAATALPAVVLVTASFVEHETAYAFRAALFLVIGAAGGGFAAMFYASDGIVGLVTAGVCAGGTLACVTFQSLGIPVVCIVIALALSGIVLGCAPNALTWWLPLTLGLFSVFLALAAHQLIWGTRAISMSALAVEVSRDSAEARRDSGAYLAQARLADALLRSNRAAEAEAPARRAVALAPNQGVSHAALGTVLLAERQPAPAAAELDSAIRLGFVDPDVYNYLGTAYSLTNRDSDAARTYQEALSRLGSNVIVLTGYADFLNRTHRPGALETATRAVALAPEYAPGHATLAGIYAHQGAVHRARLEMRRATALMPNWGSYWGFLGAYSFLDGDTAAARDAFARARALDDAGFRRNPGWQQMWDIANARKQ